MKTWGMRSDFAYEGTVLTGTTIKFGKTGKTYVSAEQYAALRKHMLNRTVLIGTSRTDTDPESLGAWLQANVTPVAIASYVGPILLNGYAERLDRTHIRIVR
ncbi:hypothetical protein [Pseudomonas massiliensis]|uniref:hypothetical protein n=1 Tax=Pseudomonas massiliensis TaxID=522492 RepID=UPI0011DE078E|nr:hypothetical protein [Pseudomonas massiliensis]